MATVNDRYILNGIFNPSLPLGECPFDDQQPADDGPHTEMEEVADDESGETLLAKQLECDGVKCAESGDLVGAIESFTRAIQTAPNRASGYNNRAQAYRLKGDNEAALEDLDKAVELSQGRGKVAAKALCQRGLLRNLMGKVEEASSDFREASHLGSDFGRMMSIQLNPYAALCNQMLAEVMKKLHQPLL